MGFLDEASSKVDKVIKDPIQVGTPEYPDETVGDEGPTPFNGLDYIRLINYSCRSVGSVPLSFTPLLRISNLNSATHILFRLLIYTLMFSFFSFFHFFILVLTPFMQGGTHRLISSDWQQHRERCENPQGIYWLCSFISLPFIFFHNVPLGFGDFWVQAGRFPMFGCT